MTAWLCVLFGWFTGAGCVAAFVGWRWFFTPFAIREEVRQLQRQLADATARAKEARALRAQLTESDNQVRQLYHEKAQLARRLVETIGQPAGRKGVA